VALLFYGTRSFFSEAVEKSEGRPKEHRPSDLQEDDLGNSGVVSVTV
jgi:hypothetical protein